MPQNNSQLTDTVVMVKPTYFAFNPETYADNLFQNKVDTAEWADIMGFFTTGGSARCMMAEIFH